MHVPLLLLTLAADPSTPSAGEREREALKYAVPMIPSDSPQASTAGGARVMRATQRSEVRINDGKVHLTHFGDGKRSAAIELRGPMADAAKACALPGGTAVSFTGAKVVERYVPAKPPSATGSGGVMNPFEDDESQGALGTWKMTYPAYCVSINASLNALDPDSSTLARARSLGEAVHRGMVETGLDRVSAQDPGKPLCAEALSAFGISQPGATHLRSDYADLDQGFSGAMDRFRKETGQEVTTTMPMVGSLTALNWLFAEGGTLNNLNLGSDLSEAYVFMPKGQVNDALTRPKWLYDGQYKPPPGTEPALLQAIVKASTSENRKLSPGDVFYLALKETKGDARLAMLLAHNTTRSLARGADAEFTGISTNLGFFSTYLEEIRGGELPEGSRPAKGDPLAGDNAGPWYHLFGTSFFEMQTQGTVGPMMVSMLSGGSVPPDLPPGAINQTTLSTMANSLEQYYREWLGGRSPDPEKYCMNLWGSKIAAKLSQNLIASGKWKPGSAGAHEPPQRQGAVNPLDPGVAAGPADVGRPPASAPVATRTGRCSSEPGATGCHKTLLYSPASITWEGGGMRLEFDQLRQRLSGSYPVLLRFFPEADGTLGVAWADESGLATKVTFTGARAGTLHVIDLHGGAEASAYVTPVRQGERLTMEMKGATPALVRPDGSPVPSVHTAGVAAGAAAGAAAVDAPSAPSQRPGTINPPTVASGEPYPPPPSPQDAPRPADVSPRPAPPVPGITTAAPPPSPAPRAPQLGVLSARVRLQGAPAAGLVLRNTGGTSWSGCSVVIPGRRRQALKALPAGFERELLYRYFTADSSAPELRGEISVECREGSARVPAAL